MDDDVVGWLGGGGCCSEERLLGCVVLVVRVVEWLSLGLSREVAPPPGFVLGDPENTGGSI